MVSTARVLLIVDFGINKLDEPLGGGGRLLLSVSLASSMSTYEYTPTKDLWAELLKFEYGLIYSPLMLRSDIFSTKISNSIRLKASPNTSCDWI